MNENQNLNIEIEMSNAKGLGINVDSNDFNSTKKPPRYDDLQNIRT